MNPLIYYVEDDEDIAYGVSKYLTSKGFHVTTTNTAEKAKELIANQIPSLILIDRNLPIEGGDSLCQWIRNRWDDLPIVFITVQGDPKDVVKGFHKGADDYVTKPFDLEVLFSRISAILRRTDKGLEEILNCGPIRINRKGLQVFYELEEIKVSSIEFQLLLILMENKNRTITRQRLLEQIWDTNGSFVNDNTLTVTIKRLREKLHNPVCFKTIRSFGYRIEELYDE